MTLTVRELIDEQASRLVGRDDELGVLRQLLGQSGPLVVFVHGIAGVGKSALAHAFEIAARADGATVLRLDCRSIEPTERGFLAALESRTGGELATAEDAARLIAQARTLVSPAELGTGFARRYYDAMQRDPGVVLAHRDMMKVFGELG